MKLIIKDYLSMMKESGELDELLPNLLLSMGIKPVSKPQVGVRQFGVDVASVGKDEDGVNKLFLFTIKQGNIGRRDWDQGKQAIRPSIEEIKDVYISTHIEPKYQKLPVKIVLCSGGEIKQDTQMTWSNYVTNNSIENEVEYDFWGGDKLALLIEEHLLDENIFPSEVRRKFRKTLILIGEPDYNMYDYYSMLNDILFLQNLKKDSVKKIQKKLMLINLSLNILLTWSRDANNLKPVLLASERTILNIWGFLHENDLFSKKLLINDFVKIKKTYYDIAEEYFAKINPNLDVKNGLNLNSNHFILESKILFEHLGILSLFGLLVFSEGVLSQEKNTFDHAKYVTQRIIILIKNHKTLLNPVLDSHIIDISLTILLLSIHDENEFINEWMYDLLQHIDFADKGFGKYIPISSDAIEDLIAFNMSDTKVKEEVFQTSILLPILAQWCVSLGLIQNYKYIYELSNDMYKNTTLQIWYHDNDLEKYIYRTNAAYKCGLVEAPIVFPEQIKEYAEQMDKIKDKRFLDENFSFMKEGVIFLALISSRHFRMPMLPLFWEPLIVEKKNKN